VGYRFVGASISLLAEAKAAIDAVGAKFDAAHSTWMDVEYPARDADEPR
jgi:hypothetical protein